MKKHALPIAITDTNNIDASDVAVSTNDPNTTNELPYISKNPKDVCCKCCEKRIVEAESKMEVMKCERIQLQFKCIQLENEVKTHQAKIREFQKKVKQLQDRSYTLEKTNAHLKSTVDDLYIESNKVDPRVEKLSKVCGKTNIYIFIILFIDCNILKIIYLRLKILDGNDVFKVLFFGVKNGEKYPASVRQFCLSVQYYSTSAYKYIRRIFNNHLPHLKTIQQWYANSDVSAEEGISDSHLKKLEGIMNQYKKGNSTSELLCTLAFDEMSIRQQILWNRNKCDFDGFVNNNDGCEDPVRSKQAIVFLLNGINYCLEFPVAYWFIQSVDKFKRKQFLLDVLEAITNSGIKLKVLTFDGYASNIPMCELLGANLQVDSPNFQTFFNNPYNNERIYIFLDPCHMIKLLRNTLANKRILYNGKNEKIEWQFF